MSEPARAALPLVLAAFLAGCPPPPAPPVSPPARPAPAPPATPAALPEPEPDVLAGTVEGVPEGVRVEVLVLGDSHPPRSVRPDADGAFQIEHLDPRQRYEVWLTADGWLDMPVLDGVRAGMPVGYPIQFPAEGAGIEIAVQDLAGRPAAGEELEVVWGGRVIARGVTGGDGRVAWRGPPVPGCEVHRQGQPPEPLPESGRLVLVASSARRG